MLELLFIFLILMTIYNLWFRKSKPKKLFSRILYSILFFVLFGLLFSWGFTPKMSLFYDKYTLFGNNTYITDYQVDDYAVVEYENKSGENELVLFSKITIGYMDADIGFDLLNLNASDQSFHVGYYFVTQDDRWFIALDQSIVNQDLVITVDGQSSHGVWNEGSEWVWFEIADSPSVIVSDQIQYDVENSW